MPGFINAQIEGFSKTRRKLREFPLKVASKADRDALRAGAKVMKAAAKREAPEGDQDREFLGLGKSLKQRIGFRLLRKRSGELGFYVVRSKTPHSNLIQLGTVNRRNKKGQFRGSTDANPYMERAFQKSRREALLAIENRMKRAVAEAIRGV